MVPLETPGRGRSAHLKPADDLFELAKINANSIPLDGVPYALVGTSMGAVRAYEIARVAERANLPKPMALIAVACPGPTTVEAYARSFRVKLAQTGRIG